jgi:hypothetical protein
VFDAELGEWENAQRCIHEAMTAVETTKERWCEADVHRIAGDIELLARGPDAAKAEAHFEISRCGLQDTDHNRNDHKQYWCLAQQRDAMA